MGGSHRSWCLDPQHHCQCSSTRRAIGVVQVFEQPLGTYQAYSVSDSSSVIDHIESAKALKIFDGHMTEQVCPCRFINKIQNEKLNPALKSQNQKSKTCCGAPTNATLEAHTIYCPKIVDLRAQNLANPRPRLADLRWIGPQVCPQIVDLRMQLGSKFFEIT